jgi:hypothetical protein
MAVGDSSSSANTPIRWQGAASAGTGGTYCFPYFVSLKARIYPSIVKQRVRLQLVRSDNVVAVLAEKLPSQSAPHTQPPTPPINLASGHANYKMA